MLLGLGRIDGRIDLPGIRSGPGWRRGLLHHPNRGATGHHSQIRCQTRAPGKSAEHRSIRLEDLDEDLRDHIVAIGG